MRAVEGLPASVIAIARGARGAVLRLLSPAARIGRALAGRPSLPPLWLRRHAGPLAAFESSASDARAQLVAWNVAPRNETILDLGCGPGAMALALGGDLSAEARYVGIDVHAPSIAWCRKRFRNDPRFRFELSNVRSAYGRGVIAVGDYRIPLGDGSVDLVVAKSLFTHLSEEEARRYLAEIARLLATGGAAVVSAFLFAAEPPAFPYGDARARWRVKNRPAAAVAFSRDVFGAWIAEASLRVEKEACGFYPGAGARITGQDVLLLRKRTRK